MKAALTHCTFDLPSKNISIYEEILNKRAFTVRKIVLLHPSI